MVIHIGQSSLRIRLASDREQPIRERDQSMNSKTILSADNKCGANCVQFDIKFKIDFKSSGVIENEHKAVKILTTFKITFLVSNFSKA